MKYFPTIFLALLSFQQSYAQNPIIVYKSKGDSTQNFYIKRVPTVPIKGLLVINLRSVSDSAKSYALAHGVMLLGLIPINPDSLLQYLTDSRVLDRTDKMIREVINDYHIPKNKIIIGGMSVAGTGAIRYVEYCKSGHSKEHIMPAGVFAVDPPLDYQRFYKASNDAIKNNFNKDAVDEGRTVTGFFKSALNGTPTENLIGYQKASVFSNTSEDDENVNLLSDIDIRLYTEPDINWWIENRRKSYYDFNSIDCAALINNLKIKGNNKAELITTNNKGFEADGTKHPHSWSIVNEKDLLSWCLNIFEKVK